MNIVFLILVFGITMYEVFHGQELDAQCWNETENVALFFILKGESRIENTNGRSDWMEIIYTPKGDARLKQN